MGNLENCYGEDATVGAPVVAGVGLAPVPRIGTNSVLSVRNPNEMNKCSVIRDNIDETWLRKGYGVKESILLDGIAEASPGKEFENFSCRLSRSYLDTGNEQGGMTPEKKGGEPTVLRNTRSRRSTTLRKSLAWDKAFFTDEGVLNNDELFAVASDTPKTLTMPELATIWDGPQTVVAPIEAHATPTKCEQGLEVRKGVLPEARKGISSAWKQEGRRPVVNSKPQQGVSHTSRRPDILHTSSLRPVRQIHTDTFSNAFSRAAAIPQGFTSLPLPNSLPRTGDRLEAGGRNLIDNPEGTGSDQMREPRRTSKGLHHQARIAALKKEHEAPLLLEPRVRLPTLNSSKKAEAKQLEVIEKAKQLKKVEHKHSQEVHVLKQCKMKAKSSDELHQMNTTLKMKPELTRSMSASALIDSPSALSRKVSFMSKKVKETLENVISGRARRVSTKPLLSHVHPVEKVSIPLKRSGPLPTVAEVKDPSHRTKPNAAVVPVKLSKDIFTVRDILRSRGPSSSPNETLKQGPALLRSKSACGVRGVPRATDSLLAPPVSPPPPPPPPPPHVQPFEPVRKPTGLRKPSPKIGFFDSGGVSSAPLKGLIFSQPLQGLQSVRTGSEASIPIEQLGRRLHGFPPAMISSAIPSVGPSSPASREKCCNIVSPSHSSDPAATFEVLTPSSSKNACGTRSPSSSGKNVVRKILEFESPSSQWSNWPVLGAVISADQLPVSAKEGLSSVSPRPLREQGSEQSTDARPNSLASPSRTSSLKVQHPELKGASHEQCSSAMEQSSQPRLSSTGFVGSSSNAMSAETDNGSMDRSSVLGYIEAESFPSTPASSKTERFSSISSFARMAVSRLTSSPAPSDDEATPKSSHKTSTRRFSRPGSNCKCLSPDLKPLPAFSEARICELEAAGPEILEKKSGPVQNSPPDKVTPESNPWSSVRKNGQPLGPFDCTKLKYISPIRIAPVA